MIKMGIFNKINDVLVGGKAMCASMGTKYKSVGDQLVTVSHRLHRKSMKC